LGFDTTNDEESKINIKAGKNTIKIESLVVFIFMYNNWGNTTKVIKINFKKKQVNDFTYRTTVIPD